jgi:hypothetical protein
MHNYVVRNTGLSTLNITFDGTASKNMIFS